MKYDQTGRPIYEGKDSSIIPQLEEISDMLNSVLKVATKNTTTILAMKNIKKADELITRAIDNIEKYLT